MANIGLRTKWFNVADDNQYQELCETLKHGDILEIKGPEDTITWAICTTIYPQPIVVYRINDDILNNWLIFKEPLVEVIKEGEIRINNAEDRFRTYKEVDDLVQCALEAVGKSGVGDGKGHCSIHLSEFVESIRYSEPPDVRNWLDKNSLSKWYTKDELPTFSWLLGKGDIVQFRKSENIGWAICTDISPQPMVVHRKEEGQPGHWSVVKESLTDLVGGSKVRINNARDKASKPKVVSDILRSVLEAVGKVGDGRCQCDQSGAHGSHFVESMRYSEQDIRQLDEKYLSDWYTKEELATFYWLLRKGDIVWLYNPSIRRCAICVEEPHLNDQRPSLVLPAFILEEMSDLGKQTDTMVSCNFDVFRQDVEFRIDNWLDGNCKTRSVEDIVKFANGEIGKKVSRGGDRGVTCHTCCKQARYNK